VIVLGVDFTSAPGPRKAITVARCTLNGSSLSLQAIDELRDFDAFESLLREPGPWIGGFDFPFGLPAELLRDLGWPTDWTKLVGFCAALSRQEWRGILDGYRTTRPVGRKYAHRATDHPAGSSSPMKLVNPPVALMFHEGAPRLADAGVHVPELADGDRKRIALEAYPGLLARSIVGRESYKSDTPSKQNPARRAARARIIRSLSLDAPLKLRRMLLKDGSGDALDAVLCAVQAAGASRKRNFGLPSRIPAGEGWIISS
jgi:Protein of unknown function (DUF429)